jgi:hypothetical protein
MGVEYESHGFIFNTVWHIFPKQSIENVESGGKLDIMQGCTVDGRWYVIAFTDRALAEEFMKRRDDPQLIALEMLSLNVWVDYLEVLYDDGHEYISFDPNEGKRIDLRPIKSVIDELRQDNRNG